MKNTNGKVKKPIPHKKVIIAVVMITIAFFGSFLVFFILQVSLNTESPIVVVISGSMEPTIHEGDLLFVAGIDAEDIKNGTAEDKDGDVIVFNAQGLWIGAPQEPIVHRVIDKYQIGDTWYFITKGDANTLQDNEPVPESRVIGVVVGGIPYIGWVKIFLERSNLLIPLLVIISALLIISIVRDIIKGEDEEQDKNNKGNKEDIDLQTRKEE
ncbi:MAG: signal peptidase I [Candidatus Lokiarchaeota archaeon]|nr:signal peptidase I [Candidatus Lokiarchaeota archaeon]